MNRSILCGVVLVGCVGWMAGCAMQTQGDGQGSVDVSTNESVHTQFLPPPPPPCPGQPGAVRTVAQGPGDHADASRFVGYLFGASASSMGLPNTQQCANVENTLNTIRARIAAGTDQLLTYAANTTVCGLPATIYEITNEGQTIANLAPAVDGCIGHPGSAPFFYYKADSVNGYIDPQVATLTQNLAGSQGASASATWAVGGGTTAWEWPAYAVGGGSNPPTAYAPCSGGALSSGASTGHNIMSSGGYFWCQ